MTWCLVDSNSARQPIAIISAHYYIQPFENRYSRIDILECFYFRTFLIMNEIKFIDMSR